MKVFIRKVVAFLLLISIVSLLAQVAISWYIKDKRITTHDTWHIIQNQENDVVFLGSSRCNAHFDPIEFRNQLGVDAVNLGVDGHSVVTMQLLRLEYYLQYNKSPRVAILSFDPFVAAGGTGEEPDINKDAYARYAWGMNEKYLPITDYFSFTPVEKYVPLYAILKYRKLNKVLFNATTDVRPYDEHHESWNYEANPPNMDEANENYRVAKNYNAIKANLSMLKTLCEKNGILLVCVQTPVYYLIYKEAEFTATERMCKELNIPFFDTNVDSLTHNKDNFYNSNHMNKNGVVKMTAYLAQDSSFVKLVK